MIRGALFALLVLNFLVRIDGLPRGNFRKERRLRRQARIPYASLSTGAISSRLRNRLRGRRPSSSSSGSGSNSGSSGSTRNRGSTGVSSSRYGSSAGYQQGGQGGSSEDGVPMGHSTYPFGVSRYTNSQNLQTPYSDQTPPGTGTSYGEQAANSYRPTYGQPVNQYQPNGYGAVGGYGAVSPYATGYGGNPYIYGGVIPQANPYMNPYAWGQGGYTGAGYTTTGGYSDVSGRAAIGSAYRDPNSRFTSWVHPQGETNNPYTGGTPYGGGGSSGGSYYGSPYGSSSGRYVPGNSEGSYSQTNPYGSSGSSRGGFSNPYSSSSSSQSQYPPSGGTGYLGGSSSGFGNAGSSPSSYGSSSYGSDQSAVGTEAVYPSGGSYGFGDRTGQDPYQGGDDGSYGSQGASNPFGSVSSYGSSGGYGGSAEDQYSQTSGSIYGATSGGRYDSFGRGRQRGRGGSSRQSSQSYQRGQSGAGQSSGRQSSRFYTSESSDPSSSDSRQSSQSYQGGQSGAGQSSGRQSSRFYVSESSNPSSSETYSSSTYFSRYGSSGASSNSQGTSRQPSRTSGRFFNPDSRQQANSQDTVLPTSYQRGRFYNSQEAVGSAQVGNIHGSVSSSNPIQVPQDGSSVSQRTRPLARGEYGAVPQREDYNNQQGTFLVARGPDAPVTPNTNKTRELHPSQQKCEKVDEGLPDLRLDAVRMIRSVRLSRIHVANLSCAMSHKANCLATSAYGNGRIPLRRLLRFNTVAHNDGTADFLPNLERKDWIYHDCHDHYHSMKEFAHFHLYDTNGTLVGEGHKVSFCLQDSECRNPCEKRYNCTKTTQGISPGCRDVYEASLDCQWIDVTDVPTGKYILKVTINPLVNGERAVLELSYTNNAVECRVEIAVRRAWASNCYLV